MSELSPGQIEALYDPKSFTYYTGKRLRGITMSRKTNHWQVIFRASDGKGQPLYCMFVAVELEDALQGLFQLVGNKGGSRNWFFDKYANW